MERELLQILQKLEERNLYHLRAAKRGSAISIFSEFEGKRENRCRFINTDKDTYELSMANHNGKWESTPFEGDILELFEMVVDDFGWVLTDYST